MDENAGGAFSMTGDAARALFLSQAIPFVGFGFMDNAIMIIAGEYIEMSIGAALALSDLAAIQTRLDDAANAIATTMNAAQMNGAALDGSAGLAMFAGTGAGDMTLSLSDGSLIATAPAGSPANSRDLSNLTALRNALTAGGVAANLDGLLFDVSTYGRRGESRCHFPM